VDDCVLCRSICCVDDCVLCRSICCADDWYAGAYAVWLTVCYAGAYAGAYAVWMTGMQEHMLCR